MKGDIFDEDRIDSLEMRVCINDKILEIYDYPNYNYKL